MASNSSYNGSITTTGKSEAIRFEKALFKQHPEFKQQAKVTAHVIGPGQILVSLNEEIEAVGADSDPIADAFLAFLERDMIEHPERLASVSDEEIARVKSLVAGVQASDADILPDDVTF